MSVEGPETPFPQGPPAGAQVVSAPHPGVVAPPPPPGPGVVPPFVAPPTDGAKQRRWLAIGLAGAATLVLCVGGLFGLGSLVVFGSQATVQQSKAAVTDYLNALKDRKFDQAYDQLCPAQRTQIAKPFFEALLSDQPAIVSFTVAQPQIGDNILVPATVNYANGATQSSKYVVVQDTSTSNYEVCGQVD